MNLFPHLVSRHGRLAVAVLAAGLVASCRTPPPPPEPPPPVPPPAEKKPVTLYEWKAEGLKGPFAIRINTDDQKAYFTKGGQDAGWTYVATGIRSHPTPVGKFRVQEKVVDKRSNLWGKIYNSRGKVSVSDARRGRDSVPSGGRFEGAHMRYWMRLTGDGIGMHQGRIPKPGSRASHGCIRLPAGVVPKVFAQVSIGTPVTIEGSGPKWSPPKPKPAPAPTTDPAAPADPATPTPAVTPNGETPSGTPPTEPAPADPSPAPASTPDIGNPAPAPPAPPEPPVSGDPTPDDSP